MVSLLDRLREALAGCYTIERELGRGGMAYVYLAHELKHDRQVALKVLRPEIASTVGGERFLHEIHTAASLQHLHILSLFDSGEADGLLYYTMPYIKGESLRDRLQREKALPFDVALKITRDVSAALEYAHGEGIVHRDIKPENILLSDGEAVVADFGIARAVDAAGKAPQTLTGHAIGTPAYMSPEQAAGSRDLDGRSDLYSLGCTFHEMLTGRLPFELGGDAAGGGRTIDRSTVIPANQTDIPEYIEKVITRVLSQRPSARYSTPTEFVRALEGEEPRAFPWHRLASALSAPRVRRVAGVTVGVALVAVVAKLLIPSPAEPPPPPSDPNAIAIMPITVRSGPASLGVEAMTRLYSGLDETGDYHVIDPNEIANYAQEKELDKLDAGEARKVAEEYETRFYVLGEAAVGRDDLQITVEMYDLEGEKTPIGKAKSSGAVAEVDELVDAIAIDLLGSMSKAQHRNLSLIAAQSTGSLEALRAYLTGEAARRSYMEANRRLDVETASAEGQRAIAEYHRSIAADSTLAPAWLRLSEAASYPKSVELAQRALDCREGKDSFHITIFKAQLAKVRGEYSKAEQKLSWYLNSNPKDVDLWEMLLGTLDPQIHWLGRPLSALREPSERILELDPDHNAFDHLIRLSLAEGDTAAFDSLTKRYLTLISETRPDAALPYRALRIFAFGPKEKEEEVLAEFKQGSYWSYFVFSVGIRWLDRPDIMRRSVEYAPRYEGPDIDCQSHALAASMELQRGRWDSARNDLMTIGMKLDPLTAITYWAQFTTRPYLNPPRKELEELRHQIQSLEEIAARSASRDSALWFTRLEGPVHVVKPYLLGLLSARLADEEMVTQYADQLAAMSLPTRDLNAADCLAATVRALLAWQRGQAAEALAILDATPWPVWNTSDWGVSGGSHARFLRAELLYELGRDTDALGWYGSFDSGGWMGTDLEAPAHFRRGQLYERLGNREMAIHHYHRFIEYWNGCDPELRPRVDEAQQRIEALLEEPAAA